MAKKKRSLKTLFLRHPGHDDEYLAGGFVNLPHAAEEAFFQASQCCQPAMQAGDREGLVLLPQQAGDDQNLSDLLVKGVGRIGDTFFQGPLNLKGDANNGIWM